MFGREIILDTMASMTDINGDYVLYKMISGEILKRIPKNERADTEIEEEVKGASN